MKRRKSVSIVALALGIFQVLVVHGSPSKSGNVEVNLQFEDDSSDPVVSNEDSGSDNFDQAGSERMIAVRNLSWTMGLNLENHTIRRLKTEAFSVYLRGKMFPLISWCFPGRMISLARTLRI